MMLSIGCEPMVLHQQYDSAQLWFPFMQGVLLRPPAQPQPEVRIEVNRKEMIQPNRLAKAMFHFGPSPQMLLPFQEHRRIGKRVAPDLVHHGFPGWERTANDEPLIVAYPKGRKHEVESYLSKNCQSPYLIMNATSVAFYSMTDAAAFRLFFSIA